MLYCLLSGRVLRLVCSELSDGDEQLQQDQRQDHIDQKAQSTSELVIPDGKGVASGCFLAEESGATAMA